ncbi:beta-carbonic anhydrase 1 [Methanobrevibacter filiformis]|uniref:Beta-carbonic anhydrase 1 n=2 Tax=Methanobrevibacter filiformis TaxID=55758 RepID=A0A166EW83_9EURY|nr:beta-carbonic anhydrase 1 [Methanobrevibacter filiformis]
MLLNEIMSNNKKFVDEFEVEKLSHLPQKKLVIVTCMDTRLVGFLEPALGIGRGDAKIIKNAGNNVICSDVIRSVAAAIFALGAEEVMLVGHTDCGMANSDSEKLKNSMIDRGIKEKDINEVNLKEWIGAIEDEESNVLKGVEKIKNHPLIPNDLPVHGLIINPNDGSLKILVKGY